ncbi:MAG: lipopolysaccharide heptosyltransferase II [Woeseiaceae bacterium]|nr:lipopolysaccharide heptosyltransferase II [Woeseiaceae bacterium]
MQAATAVAPATLIVGPSWVGDMVMAQSLFRLLKSRQADRALDVLAPGWSLPIVARMPEVRRGIDAETRHGEAGLGKRWRIAKSLRDANYDRAIVLPRSFKSALVPWMAGIPRRTGFRGESRFGLINDVRAFDRAVLDQTVKRFVALGIDDGQPLPAIPHPQLSTDPGRQQQLLDALKLDDRSPVVAMMPGAEYGPAKCWPLQHFSTLAKRLHDEGYAVWIMGSDKDATAGRQIAAESAALNLCGRTSLADVIDLLGLCEQAVSNDSGLLHIAAAVGAHVHGIYGSSSPLFTPPLTGRADIHYLALECSPCFERSCPLGHLKCLRELAPDGVLKRLRQVSAERSKFPENAGII